MKIAVVLAVIICATFLQNCAWETSATQPVPPADSQAQSAPSDKRPVLVELFTSEGCSSCPPADRALTLLEKQQPVSGVDVITLEFHVDYWDGPAWKDPFSSKVFTQRQEEYASAFKLDSDYTPQMVVDGQSEFVGSDLGRAASTIGKFAAARKGKIDAKTAPDMINIVITGLPTEEQSTVYLASIEDNLTSNVSGGENSGEKLSHTSVVRDLKPVGAIQNGVEKVDLTAQLPVRPELKSTELRYVVFVQESKSRKILAVSRVFK